MKRVYFIKPIGMEGPIKIGSSCDPSGRGKSLELWCPFPLEVVATYPGGLSVERQFHALFFNDHRGHEWFTATPALTKVIAEIAAGDFDPATLPEGRSLYKAAGKGRGRKWTDEEKARVRLDNAVKRAEKACGLVLDYPHTPERRKAFVANPGRATGGVTLAVRKRRADARLAAWYKNGRRVHFPAPARPTSEGEAA